MDRCGYEADLAWALALTAKPHLGVVERNDVFVAIGSGETFDAIRRLIKLVAVKRILVKADLVRECMSWLSGYVGHEDERSLRYGIHAFVIPCSIGVPVTVQVHDLPTTLERKQFAHYLAADTDQAAQSVRDKAAS
jgi:hypothetical protein